MTYRRKDKKDAYEWALWAIGRQLRLLDMPTGQDQLAAAIQKDHGLSEKNARQVAGCALRDARHARQVDILAESIGECREAQP